MKKIVLILVVLVAFPILTAYRLAVQTVGDYGVKNTTVQIQTTPQQTIVTTAQAFQATFQAQAATAIIGNSSNHTSFPVTWYNSGVYGIVPNPQDASQEPATVINLTPSASINSNTYLKLLTRKYPHYKIHKARWGNSIIFQVLPTGTATMTATQTATNTATNTATSTATLTVTNTATQSPTGTATNTATNTVNLTATFTYTNTATSTRTNTATQTATNTANTPTVTNTATSTITQTATNSATTTMTQTATNTATNTATVTSTYSPTNTATCNPSWTPGCFNQ